MGNFIRKLIEDFKNLGDISVVMKVVDGIVPMNYPDVF